MNLLKLLISYFAILSICDAFPVQPIRKKKEHLSTNRKKRSSPAETQITDAVRRRRIVEGRKMVIAKWMGIIDTGDQQRETHKQIVPTTVSKIVEKKKSRDGKRKSSEKKQKGGRRNHKKGKKRKKKHRKSKKGKKRNNRRKRKHRKNRKNKRRRTKGGKGNLEQNLLRTSVDLSQS